jgi:hypothetical protein
MMDPSSNVNNAVRAGTLNVLRDFVASQPSVVPPTLAEITVLTARFDAQSGEYAVKMTIQIVVNVAAADAAGRRRRHLLNQDDVSTLHLLPRGSAALKTHSAGVVLHRLLTSFDDGLCGCCSSKAP